MQYLLALAFCVTAAAAPYASNRYLQVRLDPNTAALTVTDQRNHREWTQKASGKISVSQSKVDPREMHLTLHDATTNLDVTAVITVANNFPRSKSRYPRAGR